MALDIPLISQRIEKLRCTFHTHARKHEGGGGPPRTTSFSYRQQQLRSLWRSLVENRDVLEEALCSDGATLLEARTEIARVAQFVAEIAQRFEDLLAREYREKRSWYFGFPLVRQFIQHRESRRDPLGVILIIGARVWPLSTSIEPLAAALAAGNCVALVPSGNCPNVMQALSTLLGECLDQDSYGVFCAVPENEEEIGTDKAFEMTWDLLDAVLDVRFDYIYCSEMDSRIKQLVVEKAARHMTPVDVPPSGCCPCIVDRVADLPTAARRIAIAKFTRAGQTYLAPSFIICVSESTEAQFLVHFRHALLDLFGADASRSSDYGRVHSAQMANGDGNLGVSSSASSSLVSGSVTSQKGVRSHVETGNRIEMWENALDNAVPKSNGYTNGDHADEKAKRPRLVAGGISSSFSGYFAPTVVDGVDVDSPLIDNMCKNPGPVLPIVTVPSFEDALTLARSKSPVIAMYVFTKNGRAMDIVASTMTSVPKGLILNDARSDQLPHVPPLLGADDDLYMRMLSSECLSRTSIVSTGILFLKRFTAPTVLISQPAGLEGFVSGNYRYPPAMSNYLRSLAQGELVKVKPPGEVGFFRTMITHLLYPLASNTGAGRYGDRSAWTGVAIWMGVFAVWWLGVRGDMRGNWNWVARVVEHK